MLVPEIGPNGGVQAFSRTLLAAVADLVGPGRTSLLTRNEGLGAVGTAASRAAAGVSTLGVWPSRTRAFVAPVAAARLARRVRPAAVVATHPHLAGAAVAAGRAAGGAATLCVVHGVDVWDIGGPGWRNAWTRRGLLGVDRVLAVSRYTAGRLVEQVSDVRERTRIFPNAVDIDRFSIEPDTTDSQLRTRLALGDSGPVLLTVARLATSEGPKGYDTVVQALPALIRRFPRLRYILAGRGPDADRVLKLAAESGVGDKLVLPGFVSDEELPALYRAADVFVMPSRKEGFGIVFLEAMGCGTPVVAGNADGSVDAVCDGELGAMVPPGDPAALAAALAEVLNGDHPSPASVRERVSERFGTAAFRSRLAGHLEELAPDVRRIPAPAVDAGGGGASRAPGIAPRLAGGPIPDDPPQPAV